MQCPGQDSRYWDGKDIFDVTCPKCGTNIEFFKDDSSRSFPGRRAVRLQEEAMGCHVQHAMTRRQRLGRKKALISILYRYDIHLFPESARTGRI